MFTNYWLEIWAPKASRKKMGKILSLAGDPSRSLFRAFEHNSWEEANVWELNRILDEFDQMSEPVDALGIGRQDIALWIEGNYDDRFQLDLDPMTLLRMGQEGLKLCLTCVPQQTSESEEPTTQHLPKLVDILDIWIEQEAERPEVARVTVSFDDGTFWVARFFTYRWFMQSAHRHFKQVPFFWEPDMVLVGDLSEETVKKTLAELLGKQQFEKAFSLMEPSLPSENKIEQTTVDLRIIHDQASELNLENLLSVSQAQVIQEKHFWTLRNTQTFPQTYFDFLNYYLETLEKHLPELKARGIKRRDVSIHLSYFYEDNCHLEFLPDTLFRLGKTGIGLNLTCQKAAQGVARCLE